ncbi:MAG: lipid-A-disaccharide synthase [Schleiferiaceae bacterium]|nr:lipid-A-disaccharide synthase [Schleiferiaceae bacterium]
MRIFWIAGEPSGDVQAASLVQAIQKAHPKTVHSGWGGVHMQKEGVELLFNLPANPIMGFIEVVLKARIIREQFRQVKRHITEFEPDVLILVDFPGFNLRIAEWAQARGMKVVYFIPPKVWAWKQGRLRKLSASTDLILSILPFEESWYAAKGHALHYVGNPLAERYAGKTGYAADSKEVVLLPGSRNQEVQRLLPVFCELAAALPAYRFKVVRAASVLASWPMISIPENVEVIDAPLLEVAASACFALTCSGTASLEIALLGIPQAVVYKANPISLAIARKFVKVPFFSLPNLILDQEAVPELLQEQVNVDVLKALIRGGGEEQLDHYHRLDAMLGAQTLEQDAVGLISELVLSSR